MKPEWQIGDWVRVAAVVECKGHGRRTLERLVFPAAAQPTGQIVGLTHRHYGTRDWEDGYCTWTSAGAQRVWLVRFGLSNTPVAVVTSDLTSSEPLPGGLPTRCKPSRSCSQRVALPQKGEPAPTRAHMREDPFDRGITDGASHG